MKPEGYRILDSGQFQKLEQVGPFRIVRPSSQAVWSQKMTASAWEDYDAKFTRSGGGQGKWHIKRKLLKNSWVLEQYGLKFKVQCTDFGHLGIFPEHLEKFGRLKNLLKPFARPKILNLFAYTGAATMASLQQGAEVVHVDSSKTSVAWAVKNAELNNLAKAPVRWIIDDVRKFVQREIRRGASYQGIILDPPSFGRGGKGEVWKIEKDLPLFLESLAKLLSPEFAFLMLTSHSSGYTPIALSNLVTEMFPKGKLKSAPKKECGELKLLESTGREVPNGAFALLCGKN